MHHVHHSPIPPIPLQIAPPVSLSIPLRAFIPVFPHPKPSTKRFPHMKTTRQFHLVLLIWLGCAAGSPARTMEEWMKQGDAPEAKLQTKPSLDAEKLATG